MPVASRSGRPAMVRDAAVLAVAVGLFGVSFGVLARSAGLSAMQAQAMSLLVFTGASQFAAAAIVEAGGGAASAVATGLVLAARNAAYGIAVGRIAGGGRLRRALAAHVVVDETAALALAQPDPADRMPAFWTMAAIEFSLWNLGTYAGTELGARIGDPGRYGLDAIFPAAFVVLALPHLGSGPRRVAAAAGVAVAVLTTPLAPAGVPILLALAAGVAVALASGGRRGTA